MSKRMMKLKFSLIILLLAFASNLKAQCDQHCGPHHDHHRSEIGIANAPVYFLNEKEFAYGLHVHYIYNIEDSKFGFGLGYERIFDEHKHNSLGLIGSYQPLDGLSINLSPGITFEDEDSSHINFGLHVETTYEFEINNFHIGPVLGFAYDPEDYHISLGLHIGYGF